MRNKRELEIYYGWSSGDVSVTQCVFCIHNLGKLNADGIPTCKAYPSGIPKRIINNRILHDQVFEDQQGEAIFTTSKGENPLNKGHF